MEKIKQPAIHFRGIYLAGLHFDLPHVKPKDFKYEIDFDVSYNIDTKGTRLTTTLHVKLYKDFNFDLLGIFTVDEKNKEEFPLKQFAENNAPILLLPFAREIIHNLTSKSLIPTLMLPPINIKAFLEKKRKKETKSKSKK